MKNSNNLAKNSFDILTIHLSKAVVCAFITRSRKISVIIDLLTLRTDSSILSCVSMSTCQQLNINCMILLICCAWSTINKSGGVQYETEHVDDIEKARKVQTEI